jgi:hypothetical protein
MRSKAPSTPEINEFYEEICAAILVALEQDPDAPIAEVTREVAEGMLLGEDDDVAVEIKRRLKI